MNNNWRAKNVVFTCNNPSEHDLARLREQQSNLNFYIWQIERGNSGTRHIQGYCQLRGDSYWGIKKWKQYFTSRFHFDKARGSPEANITYCSKEEGREEGPFQGGKPSYQGRRSDLQEAAEDFKTFTSVRAAADKHAEQFIRYSRGLLQFRSLHAQKRNWPVQVFWIYGPTGAGKSRFVNDIAPDAYWKPSGGIKWWDHYDGESDIIIDDYRKDFCKFHDLLTLLDRYPYKVEYKGGTCELLSKRFFITTPKSVRETWDYEQRNEQIEQLLRRITYEWKFPDQLAEATTLLRRVEPVNSEIEDLCDSDATET